MVWIIAVLALAFSFFYGRYALELFRAATEQQPMKVWPTKSWHFFVNFLDCMVGWAVAYYLVFHRLLPFHSYTFKLEDTVLLAIALLGVTGFLPYVLGTHGFK